MAHTDSSSSFDLSGGGGSGSGAGESGVQAHYDNLLGEITSLQADLSRTFAVCQQLKAENEELRNNYEQVSLEARRAKDKLEDTKQQCLDEARARIALERRHEELCSRWREQLEQKEQEFDDLQASMEPPRDLEVLKIRIQEELEIPHAQQVERLEKERNQFATEAREATRQLQLLRTEYEQFTIDQGEEARANQEAHKAQVAELNSHIAKLQAAIDDTATADAQRQVKRLTAQMEMREADLLAENEQLRAACADAIAKEREMATRLKNEQADRVTLVSKVTGERANAEARALAAETEVKRLQRLLHEERSQHKQAMVVQTTTKMEELQSQLAEFMEDREKRLEAEREVDRLKSQLESRVLAPRTDAFAASDSKVMDGGGVSSPVRRRYQKRLAALETDNRHLEAKVAHLRKKNERYKKRTTEAIHLYDKTKAKLKKVQDELYRRLSNFATPLSAACGAAPVTGSAGASASRVAAARSATGGGGGGGGASGGDGAGAGASAGARSAVVTTPVV